MVVRTLIIGTLAAALLSVGGCASGNGNGAGGARAAGVRAQSKTRKIGGPRNGNQPLNQIASAIQNAGASLQNAGTNVQTAGSSVVQNVTGNPQSKPVQQATNDFNKSVQGLTDTVARLMGGNPQQRRQNAQVLNRKTRF